MSLHPDYAEVDDLKRYLRIPGLYEGSLNTEEDAFDDIELALAITAASRAIDTSTNRQFGVLTVADTFKYTAEYVRSLDDYVVKIDDLMTITNLAIECDGVAITDYELFPFNAAKHNKPWTHIILGSTASFTTGAGEIEVTGLFGWTSVPDTIKNATLMQAARFFKRRDAAFGVAGSPEMGNQMRLLNKVDPDVEVMLNTYKRRWGAV